MKVLYSPVHLDHAPPEEFEGGRMSPAVEVPARAERVRAEPFDAIELAIGILFGDDDEEP